MRAKTVQLKPLRQGVSQAKIKAREPGLYRVEDGPKTALTAAWMLNPKEMADLRATDEGLAPVAKATGGGLAWIVDGLTEFRRVQLGRDTAGRGWMGFLRNEAYIVTGMKEVSLLPGLLALLFALGALIGAWWREGR